MRIPAEIADTAALYDVLNCASLAVLAAEGGQQRRAEEAYMEASFAACAAFGEDTPEARALFVVLGAIGPMVTGRAA